MKLTELSDAEIYVTAYPSRSMILKSVKLPCRSRTWDTVLVQIFQVIYADILLVQTVSLLKL